MTELATTHGGSTLTLRDDQTFWTDHQIAALAQMGVEDAPNGDLAVFFHHSTRTGLDPFARQIYMIGRWSPKGTKYTIQTSIDGFRLIGRRAADRAKETLEISDTEWCGQDGAWRDVWTSPEPPAAARVAVYRNGGRFPAVALFREYAQTKKDGSLTQMWEQKGALMVAKCAEALAWRKAFPQDLSGLYTSDEMDAAANPAPLRPDAVQAQQGPAMASDEQLVAMKDAMGEATRDQALDYISGVVGRKVENPSTLTADEAASVMDALCAVVDDDEDPEVVDAELVEAVEADENGQVPDPWTGEMMDRVGKK